jgi:hypothetical protein
MAFNGCLIISQSYLFCRAGQVLQDEVNAYSYIHTNYFNNKSFPTLIAGAKIGKHALRWTLARHFSDSSLSIDCQGH